MEIAAQRNEHEKNQWKILKATDEPEALLQVGSEIELRQATQQLQK